MGIRESRHIEGLYRLTGEDVRSCRVPKDTIALMATNMDTHNKDDPGGNFITVRNGLYFGVPYRSLIPKNVKNLLIAGRAISADALAGSAIRMIPCCIAFGQAAGIAAAMAAVQKVSPSEINFYELRTSLIDQGAYLGLEE